MIRMIELLLIFTHFFWPFGAFFKVFDEKFKLLIGIMIRKIEFFLLIFGHFWVANKNYLLRETLPRISPIMATLVIMPSTAMM